MSSLYLLPHPVLVALSMVLTAAAMLQLFCTVYGFFTFRYLRRHLWRSLWEAGVLCELFLQMVYVAEALYQSRDGFYVPHPYLPFRLVLFLVTAALSMEVAASEGAALPLSVPLVLVLTPVVPGGALPLLFLFWLFRAARHLLIYRRQRREGLSAFSVKEAVDTMDFGILYCRADGGSDGQILLANRKMQELMFTMTGKRICSGKVFYERLEAGEVLPECRREPRSPQPVYLLPDGRIWRFDLLFTWVNDLKCAILLASDTTEYMHTTDALYRQNEALEQRNGELKAMLRELQSTCRTEETLRAKSRVHDLLGQQISMVLRSVREHREPGEALLQAFARGFPEELRAAYPDCAQSLRAVAESFQSLGVAVEIRGVLPEASELQKTFYEIATEAMTNAVHHGYASEISVVFSHRENEWGLTVRDNGTVKETAIQEGGGLQSMRRKAQALGGSFSYEISPHFTIFIRIPEGGSL